MNHEHFNKTSSKGMKEAQTTSGINQVQVLIHDHKNDHNNDYNQENEFNRKSQSPLFHIKLSEMGGSKFHLEVRKKSRGE